MGYCFDLNDDTITNAVRRIALEEIDTALTCARAADAAGQTHALRKNVKKLRGLIRLLRPRLHGYGLENAALRDAGRMLSGQRDAEVMQAMLADLARDDDSPAAEAARALAAELAARPPEADRTNAMASFLAAMEALRDRASRWSPKGKGFSTLEPGLLRTLAAAQGAARAADDHPDAEAIHQWRKRVKDHWYHARLLRPIWPEAMAPHIEAADALGELLGLHHDLAVLRAHLADSRLPPDAQAALDALAARRQSGLEHDARRLAARLFADTPEALVARWRQWWQVWQAG